MLFPLQELATKRGMYQFMREAKCYSNNQLLPHDPDNFRYFIKQVFNSYTPQSHIFRPELGSNKKILFYKFKDIVGLTKYGKIKNIVPDFHFDILETAGRPLLMQWQNGSKTTESGKVYAIAPGTSYTLIATGKVVLRINRVAKSQLRAWRIDKLWGKLTVNVKHSPTTSPVTIMQHGTSSFPATVRHSAAFPDSSVATVPVAALQESSPAPFLVQNASVPAAATIHNANYMPISSPNAEFPATTETMLTEMNVPVAHSVPASRQPNVFQLPQRLSTSVPRPVAIPSHTPSLLTPYCVLEEQPKQPKLEQQFESEALNLSEPGPSAPHLNKEKKNNNKMKKNKKEKEKRKLNKVMPRVVAYLKKLMDESSSDDSMW